MQQKRGDRSLPKVLKERNEKLIERDLLTLPLRTLQGLCFHASCLSKILPIARTDLNQVCNLQTHTQGHFTQFSMIVPHEVNHSL